MTTIPEQNAYSKYRADQVTAESTILIDHDSSVDDAQYKYLK
jgi:hypothetical protein